MIWNLNSQPSISQNVVSVKLMVNYDVTMLFSVEMSLLTINFTLTTFCEIWRQGHLCTEIAIQNLSAEIILIFWFVPSAQIILIFLIYTWCSGHTNFLICTQMKKFFEKWRYNYMRNCERENQLKKLVDRKNWQLMGSYMDSWKTSLLAKQAIRIYNMKLTGTVLEYWHTFTQSRCQIYLRRKLMHVFPEYFWNNYLPPQCTGT